MPITTAMCASFKAELAQAVHNFTNSTGHVFKLALIKQGSAGNYNAATTSYANLTANGDEVSGSGYTAGGLTLTNVTPTVSGATAIWSFASPVSWSAASFSADGCLIYNSSAANRAVSVHDFGGTKTVTNGTLSVTFPTVDANNAILRIA